MSEQPTSIIPGSSGSGFGDSPSPTRPTRRPLTWNPGTDLGLLLLRFGIGAVFFGHGAQKVFGLWGGIGIDGFARALDSSGFNQSVTLSWVTGLTELIGGAFVVLGVLTPLAATGLLAVMIPTVIVNVGAGWFVGPGAAINGVEYNVALGLAAAAIIFTGPGRIALDNGRTWHRRPAPWGVLALIIGVAASLVVFFTFHR
ncbi:DoxX family protein [Pseudonocardia sp. GCM10023141]|uniref:DoxX family protein n=1 Tax=Pseudonocardia sp. GCM10023141 TaxID=3252653 RepID=UPI003614BD90